MKRIIQVVLIVILANVNLKSQNYLNSESKWYALDGDSFDQYYNISTYTIEGDTVINNLVYYKVLKEYDQFLDHPLTNDTIITRGLKEWRYLREESKIFYEGYLNGSEYAIVDFNLELGDTVVGEIYVDSIGFIEIQGESRKIFHTNTSQKIYEGIGTNNGPFDGLILQGELFGSLLCYQHNTESYSMESYNSGGVLNIKSCDSFFLPPIVTNIEMLDENDLILYPNPVRNRFKIEMSKNKEIKLVKIFSQIGVELISLIEIDNRNNVIIDLSEINYKGLMYVHINDGRNSMIKSIIRM